MQGSALSARRNATHYSAHGAFFVGTVSSEPSADHRLGERRANGGVRGSSDACFAKHKNTMLTEENVDNDDNPIAWKRRYKRTIMRIHGELQRSEHFRWHVRGLADAKMRMFETYDQTHRSLQGVLECRPERLCALLEDVDFERRSRVVGDVWFAHADWVVEETFCSRTLGDIYVVKQPGANDDHSLYWSHYEPAANTWIFIYAPCYSRLQQCARKMSAVDRWTAIAVKKIVDNPFKCFLRVVERNGRPLAELYEGMWHCQAFCNNDRRWQAVYSEGARVARDVDKRVGPSSGGRACD